MEGGVDIFIIFYINQTKDLGRSRKELDTQRRAPEIKHVPG